jgi:uncharacterized membrane protein
MAQRQIRWLYGEIPKLIQGGVVSEETAERLRDHYGPAKVMSTARLAIVLCSTLGAALIGAGIILLLAHNWEGLGRPLRALLSFLPMLAGQGLVGWTLLRKQDSMAWREASSTFLALSIGASIALIGQTYNIPGNLAGFLFTWLLLGLPLVYLHRSTMVLVLYLVGAVSWAISAQAQGDHAVWYWLFLGGVLPAIAQLQNRHRSKPRTALVLWFFALTLCVGLGVALEKVLPGLWIVAYAALFACFCLLGRGERFADTPGQPLLVVGRVGTVVLALLLTFDHWWRRIGFSHYRSGDTGYLEWLGIQDYVLVLGLLGAVVVLMVGVFRSKEHMIFFWVASPLIACICYGAMGLGIPEALPLVAFNAYLLVLGVSLLYAGVREGSLGLANGGMGVLALLFTVRFFDSDLSIMMRGVAFIVMGAGFLIFNLWLSRKRVSSPKEVSS